MSITKKIRFEVFKRDGFQCAYCGKTPPGVMLELDHIEPRSRGGSDEINNLITSCLDCNRGKSNIRLDKAPPKLAENLEVLKEKEAQLKAYNNLCEQVEKRKSFDAERINDCFKKWFPDHELSERFKKTSLCRFLAALSRQEILDAMEIAGGKRHDRADQAIKYFCGICWTKIRNRADGN